MRWVPGAGPVVIEPLGAGLVNLGARVTRQGRSYSLRISQADLLKLALDRDWECQVLACASGAGVGPQIRCCEPREGIVVADWVCGGPWTAVEILRPANITAFARLLRRVHGLGVPQPPRVKNASSWIADYTCAPAGATTQAHSAALDEIADGLIRRLAADPCRALVLCHSDLHRDNVIVGEQIVLLDWEYAHVSDPYWDLAGWIANNDGAPAFARDLLEAYLERVPSDAESVRLQRYVWLFDYVCLLWSEVYASSRPGDASSVRARIGVLTRRLSTHTGSLAG